MIHYTLFRLLEKYFVTRKGRMAFIDPEMTDLVTMYHLPIPTTARQETRYRRSPEDICIWYKN
ncbi:protein of unknown function [Kyrpidia spormannii]|uniref:Uncharacterized protein n=1 Tax=Kyrpidia spormannii TaxID=2055160 RepID=A0ACA8ZDS8_9BACL|nr:protein of unknown function [Kyrpidia spormannii]